MIKKTPLRLVKTVTDSDEDIAAPVVEMDGNDVITRKVPNPVADSETFPATPPPTVVQGRSPGPVRTAPVSPQGARSGASATVSARKTVSIFMKAWQTRNRKILISIATLLVAAMAIAFLLRKPASTPLNVPEPHLEGSPAPHINPALPTPPAAALPAAAAGPAKMVPETIRLQVTAAPNEATLSLDGNLVAGHILNLMVPKDRGIHVISASAPGHIPFNQQVSFDSDVILSITLRRDRAFPSRPAARARTQMGEKKTKGDTARTPAPPIPRTNLGFEPGMNLEAPAARANAKSIDERNPYKP